MTTGTPDTETAAGAPVSSTARPARGGGAARTALGAVALAVLAKGKFLLVVLQGLKLGKLFLTMGSMLAMILFEAQRSGWLFGVGFVLMILVHELGHGWAIKKEGLAAGYPVFIPFVGAMIALRGQPRHSLVEARIAIAGPVAGAAAALAVTALFLATRQRLFLALAYTGFLLNLFNLIPFSPLDGGRVAQMFSRRMWYVGIALMAVMFFVTKSPMLLLVGAMGLINAFRRGAGLTGPDEAEVTPADRQRMAAHYFGLCGLLAAGMFLAGRLLPSVG